MVRVKREGCILIGESPAMKGSIKMIKKKKIFFKKKKFHDQSRALYCPKLINLTKPIPYQNSDMET